MSNPMAAVSVLIGKQHWTNVFAGSLARNYPPHSRLPRRERVMGRLLCRRLHCDLLCLMGDAV